MKKTWSFEGWDAIKIEGPSNKIIIIILTIKKVIRYLPKRNGTKSDGCPTLALHNLFFGDNLAVYLERTGPPSGRQNSCQIDTNLVPIKNYFVTESTYLIPSF